MAQKKVPQQRVSAGSIVIVAVKSPDPDATDPIKFASLRWPGEQLPKPGETLADLGGARVVALCQVKFAGQEGKLVVSTLKLLDLELAGGGYVTHLGEAFVEAYKTALEPSAPQRPRRRPAQVQRRTLARRRRVAKILDLWG